MKQSKFSSPYSLVKDPLQKTTAYSIFYAKNKQTNQFWLAKVFHGPVLQQLSLEEHVAYNQQVLRNVSEKQKGHVVYVSEIFIKGNDTFFIQEKYETKLSNYLISQGTLKAKEIQRILKDAFQGICDIYEESYIHCNLRSEHLVKVAGQNYQNNQEDYVWKIDWLVLDSNEFPIDTPFTWKRDSASPQDKKKDSELPQQMLDAQIVWNFGYLAMEMLIGQKALSQMLHKQNDIGWARIKQLTKNNPDLYELVNACFRYNFKERISLNRFLDLKIFHDVARPGIQDYFMTCSKIFRGSTLSSFQKSFNLKSKSKMLSVNMKNKIAKPQAPNTYFNSLEQVKEEIYDQQSQKNTNIYCLLVQVSNYLNLIHSSAENPSKMLQNRAIIQIFILKLATVVESKIKQSSWNRLLQNIQAQHKSKIKNQSRQIKNIRQKENTLVLRFNLNLKKEYNQKELIMICNKLCGYAYSRLREDCQQNEDPNKLKAMVYFSLIPYLLNVQDWSLLEEAKKENIKDYVELFKNGELNMLLKLSQTIIKQYFQVDA